MDVYERAAREILEKEVAYQMFRAESGLTPETTGIETILRKYFTAKDKT